MRFAHIDGDHLTLLNVYHAFKQSEFPSVIVQHVCIPYIGHEGALLAKLAAKAQ